MLRLAIPERKHFCGFSPVAVFLIPELFLFFRVVFLREVFHHSFEYLKLPISSHTLWHTDV